MVMDFKKRHALIVLMFSIGPEVKTSETFYLVKKGDTLSEILAGHGLKVYGKNGALKKTLKLNPGLGKTIYPETKILLPITKVDAPAEGKIAPPIIVEQERSPGDDFKQSFYWKLSPAISWKALSSTDENTIRRSEVSALSNTSFGMEITYGMHFEPGLDIYSSYFIESMTFEGNGAINLARENFFGGRFSTGLWYEKRWNLEMAMSDELFLTNPSAMTVDIKRVSLPELKVTYLKDFYQYRSALLLFSMSGNAFFPRSSPSVDSRFSYGVGGAFLAKLNNQSFRIGFDMHQLEADGNSTKSQNIYWRYTWETL